MAASKVLVVGVYLADKPSWIRSIVHNLGASSSYQVVQRWAVIGEAEVASELRSVTRVHNTVQEPKFALVNRLLAHEPFSDYEYVLVVDDDIRLPDRFVDRFLGLQTDLGFSLAQPARTSNSYIDHPLVQQIEHILARQTLFVEIGPVTSFHRSIFSLLLPFDLTSPMGWGYENIWSYRLYYAGFKMGIIDAYPVDHSLRATATYYNSKEAGAGAERILKAHKHFSLKRCYKTLQVFQTMHDLASGSRILRALL
jgi:hypothetical protein